MTTDELRGLFHYVGDYAEGIFTVTVADYEQIVAAFESLQKQLKDANKALEERDRKIAELTKELIREKKIYGQDTAELRKEIQEMKRRSDE